MMSNLILSCTSNPYYGNYRLIDFSRDLILKNIHTFLLSYLILFYKLFMFNNCLWYDIHLFIINTINYNSNNNNLNIRNKFI